MAHQKDKEYILGEMIKTTKMIMVWNHENSFSKFQKKIKFLLCRDGFLFIKGGMVE